jgi:hypothetical protein
MEELCLDRCGHLQQHSIYCAMFLQDNDAAHTLVATGASIYHCLRSQHPVFSQPAETSMPTSQRQPLPCNQ